MARKEFSRSVKVAALKRCSKPDGIPKCETCGCQIKQGRMAFDHVNPDGLTGEPTLENCKVLCSQFEGSCHDIKTRVDQTQIADAKRWEARDMGIKKTSRNPMPGSKASGWKRRMDGSVVRRNG